MPSGLGKESAPHGGLGCHQTQWPVRGDPAQAVADPGGTGTAFELRLSSDTQDMTDVFCSFCICGLHLGHYAHGKWATGRSSVLFLVDRTKSVLEGSLSPRCSDNPHMTSSALDHKPRLLPELTLAVRGNRSHCWGEKTPRLPNHRTMAY